MGETVAVAVHLEDVDVVGEPVEQGAGQALGAERGCPLVEGQVLVTMVEPRSYLWENTSNSSSAPVWDSGT